MKYVHFLWIYLKIKGFCACGRENSCILTKNIPCGFKMYPYLCRLNDFEAILSI
jgi:hypothetical protein